MKHTKILLLLIVVIGVTGCAPEMHKNYEGIMLNPSDHVVLSSSDINRLHNVRLIVTKINGKEVNVSTAAGHYILPGIHEIEIKASTIGTFSGGAVHWKEAKITGTYNLQGGHTYFPAVSRTGDIVSVYLIDKGVGYPEDCMFVFQEAYYEHHRKPTPEEGCK